MGRPSFHCEGASHLAGASQTVASSLDAPRQRLVIFTRYPEPGRTKTRMIPALGAMGAAELQRRMTQHTLRWADRLHRSGRVAIEVRFDGGDAALMAERFGSAFAYRPQSGGDLGRRMAQAFADVCAAGAPRVVIVGTDCPELSAQLAVAAFDALQRFDVVFGPATDGGYYLIGLRRPVPELFEGVVWGSGAVLSTSIQIAARLGLSVRLLKPLDDVDRPEDLGVWKRVVAGERRALRPPTPAVPREGGGGCTRISIIIPTRNEAEQLPMTLAHVQHVAGVEVIVVDGGSSDETVAVARACGARVVRIGVGRARQMNAGAALARGEVLLFLHADTRLDEGFDAAVCSVLRESGIAAGAFALRIDGGGRRLRVVERGVQIRSRVLGLPYGDQALFVRADTFREIGGYPEMPIMEDVELVRRLRRRGRIAMVDVAARTSGRRWQRLGVWQTTFLNQVCLAAYFLGVSPGRIARWYGAVGSRQYAVGSTQ
jgi:rSAM/selenodomain-associated transferase 2/rSAM/selenodomain-associated transferase 1